MSGPRQVCNKMVKNTEGVGAGGVGAGRTMCVEVLGGQSVGGKCWGDGSHEGGRDGSPLRRVTVGRQSSTCRGGWRAHDWRAEMARRSAGGTGVNDSPVGGHWGRWSGSKQGNAEWMVLTERVLGDWGG